MVVSGGAQAPSIGVNNDEIRTRWRGRAVGWPREGASAEVFLPPSSGLESLARLVGDVNGFRSEHWGRAPLHHRAPGGFDDVFSLADLDELLAAGSTRWPAFRLRQTAELDGSVIDESRYTTGRMNGKQRIEDVLDGGRVISALNNGATLQLVRMDETWVALARLCADLQLALSHPADADVFVTPAHAQGLATHYDQVDVFVLQFTGRKQWSVYEPPMRYPLDPSPVRTDPGPAILSCVLEPGDCLYLPRGFPHDARSMDALSGHISVGVNSVSWVSVFERLFELLVGELRDSETFRESLDIGFARDDRCLERGLLERRPLVMRLLGERLEAAAVQDLTRDLSLARRPVLTGLLDEMARMDRLSPDTPLRRRAGAVAFVSVVGGELTLALADRELVMPPRLEPALRWILARDRLTIRDLPGLYPASAKLLVGRLVLAGLLATDDCDA